MTLMKMFTLNHKVDKAHHNRKSPQCENESRRINVDMTLRLIK